MPFWRSGRGDGDHTPRPEDTVHEAREVEAAMRRVAEQDTPENRRGLFELIFKR